MLRVTCCVLHEVGEVTNLSVNRMALERPTKEGDSPVCENNQTSVLLESSDSLT